MNDWEAYTQEWSMINNWYGPFEVEEAPVKEVFTPSRRFTRRFPKLTHLLRRARYSIVRKRWQTHFLLLGWTAASDESCGWLCFPPCLPTFPLTEQLVHLEDHRILLAEFGGIRETWNPPSSLLTNLTGAFSLLEAGEGWGGHEELIWEKCKSRGFKPDRDPADYCTFAREANGDCFVYHKKTGQVLFVAHDPGLAEATVLEGWPDTTLYTLKTIPTFRAWVERSAEQWLASVAG